MRQTEGDLEGLIERSLKFEKKEDKKAIQRSEPVEGGDTKEVYRGLRNDFLMEEEDFELRKVFRDLSSAERVVNTWIYTQDGLDIIKQEEIPFSFQTILNRHGPEYAIREAVEVFENIANHGYVYCDLAPENIKFNHYKKALAIDYLDQEALEPIEDVETKFAAARSYDLFLQELASLAPDLKAKEIEEQIDKYSNHIEVERYTGELPVDFI